MKELPESVVRSPKVRVLCCWGADVMLKTLRLPRLSVPGCGRLSYMYCPARNRTGLAGSKTSSVLVGVNCRDPAKVSRTPRR